MQTALDENVRKTRRTEWPAQATPAPPSVSPVIGTIASYDPLPVLYYHRVALPVSTADGKDSHSDNRVKSHRTPHRLAREPLGTPNAPSDISLGSEKSQPRTFT